MQLRSIFCRSKCHCVGWIQVPIVRGSYQILALEPENVEPSCLLQKRKQSLSGYIPADLKIVSIPFAPKYVPDTLTVLILTWFRSNSNTVFASQKAEMVKWCKKWFWRYILELFKYPLYYHSFIIFELSIQFPQLVIFFQTY